MNNKYWTNFVVEICWLQISECIYSIVSESEPEQKTFKSNSFIITFLTRSGVETSELDGQMEPFIKHRINTLP